MKLIKTKQGKHRYATLVIIFIVIAITILLTQFTSIENTTGMAVLSISEFRNLAGMEEVTGRVADIGDSVQANTNDQIIRSTSITPGNWPYNIKGASTIRRDTFGDDTYYTYITEDTTLTLPGGKTKSFKAGEVAVYDDGGDFIIDPAISGQTTPQEVYNHVVEVSVGTFDDDDISVKQSEGWSTPYDPNDKDDETNIENLETIFVKTAEKAESTSSSSSSSSSSTSEGTSGSSGSSGTSGCTNCYQATTDTSGNIIVTTPGGSTIQYERTTHTTPEGDIVYKYDDDEYYTADGRKVDPNNNYQVIDGQMSTELPNVNLETTSSSSSNSSDQAPMVPGAPEIPNGTTTSGESTTQEPTATEQALSNRLNTLNNQLQSKGITSITPELLSHYTSSGLSNDQIVDVISSSPGNAEYFINEANAVNTYTNSNPTTKYELQPGGIVWTECGSKCAYNGDDFGSTAPESSPLAGQMIYEEKSKGFDLLGKGTGTRYYYIDPTTGEETYITSEEAGFNPTQLFSKANKQAHEDYIQQLYQDIEDGKIIGPDGQPIEMLKAHEIAYFEQYEKVSSANRNYLVNLLNQKISEAWFGWTADVPSQICKNIFGLGDVPQDSWLSMPHNTSPSSLQYEITKNIRTITIEGEKEEISEDMYRYSYTLKMLSNASVEWITYLYNTCTEKDSQEIFYDYGYLSSGEYFMYHYAGSSGEDMIFECESEECLFDQACVQLMDEEEPYCTSLSNGEGFVSPSSGSDYDCEY